MLALTVLTHARTHSPTHNHARAPTTDPPLIVYSCPSHTCPAGTVQVHTHSAHQSLVQHRLYSSVDCSFLRRLSLLSATQLVTTYKPSPSYLPPFYYLLFPASCLANLGARPPYVNCVSTSLCSLAYI